jgi:hypothetical protein
LVRIGINRYHTLYRKEDQKEMGDFSDLQEIFNKMDLGGKVSHLLRIAKRQKSAWNKPLPKAAERKIGGINNRLGHADGVDKTLSATKGKAGRRRRTGTRTPLEPYN